MKKQNTQDYFLNQARVQRIPLTIFLMNGVQMKGRVVCFDSFVVVFDSDGKQQVVYKHAISTIIPATPINFADAVEEELE